MNGHGQGNAGFNGVHFVYGLLLIIFISLLLFGSTDIETPLFIAPTI